MSILERPERPHHREVSWKSADPRVSACCSAFWVVAEDGNLDLYCLCFEARHGEAILSRCNYSRTSNMVLDGLDLILEEGPIGIYCCHRR